jgi:hypothetical protein
LRAALVRRAHIRAPSREPELAVARRTSRHCSLNSDVIQALELEPFCARSIACAKRA